MLRKKLKLDDKLPIADDSNGGADPAGKEFSLSQFANKPKAKAGGAVTATVEPSATLVTLRTVDECPAEGTGQPIWQQLYHIELELSEELKKISLPSEVAAMYNPVEYAAELHCAYMSRFLDDRKAVLFVGMNPGPWGMCQTGVPFGYIPAIRDWMHLQGSVQKPSLELPARPVEGLDCTREEQSGKRWWGLYQKLCGTPENFFRNCFVHNLCPAAYFHGTGRNITPSELKGKAKGEVQSVCERFLAQALDLLKPKVVVSVGRYTEDRIKSLVKQRKLDSSVTCLCMPHPSPRSLNNTNWNEKAEKWLIDNGVMPYISNTQP